MVMKGFSDICLFWERKALGLVAFYEPPFPAESVMTPNNFLLMLEPPAAAQPNLTLHRTNFFDVFLFPSTDS